MALQPITRKSELPMQLGKLHVNTSAGLYDLSVTLAPLTVSHAARRKFLLTKKHKHKIIPAAIQVSHPTDSIDSRAWPHETEAKKIQLLRCIRITGGMPDRQTDCTTLTASRSLACCCQRKARAVLARARRKRVPLLPHRIEAQKPPQTLRSTAEAP